MNRRFPSHVQSLTGVPDLAHCFTVRASPETASVRTVDSERHPFPQSQNAAWTVRLVENRPPAVETPALCSADTCRGERGTPSSALENSSIPRGSRPPFHGGWRTGSWSISSTSSHPSRTSLMNRASVIDRPGGRFLRSISNPSSCSAWRSDRSCSAVTAPPVRGPSGRRPSGRGCRRRAASRGPTGTAPSKH